MHPNPFSPSFSIHPQLFFGRSGYIDRFATALDTLGSAGRCFFLTGVSLLSLVEPLRRRCCVKERQRNIKKLFPW